MTDQENKSVPRLDDAKPHETIGEASKPVLEHDDALALSTATVNKDTDSSKLYAESNTKPKAAKVEGAAVEPAGDEGIPLKQDGIDKLLAAAGLQPKDKKMVMIGAALLVIFLVFTVFGDRQRISGFDDGDQVQDFSAVSAGEARGASVVLLDTEVLIKAAVGQSVASQGDTSKMVDTSKLGDIIRAAVKNYRSQGYVVLNKSAALAFPASADVTTIIAKEAGINLEYADMDLFTKANAPVDAAMQPATE